MKTKITFFVVILFAFIANAQIYTPSGTIQGTSGNDYVGIGTNSPLYKLNVYGSHSDARIVLHSVGGGDEARQADLMLWASEPGLTYSGAGIGNNITNYSASSAFLKLLNPARGGSYLRLLDNSLSLNVVSSSGTDTQGLSINGQGNVGIGVGSADFQTKLHVKESGTSNSIWRGRIVASGDNNAVVIGEYNGNARLGAHNAQLTAWSNLIIQADGGNVGIGMSNPINKLDVNGTIHSKEVKVDMIGWSDFVFKKEYDLPTLAEVEKQIKEKGHLANIPSEEEVLKNGISLGEMNIKLLQKIEELSLYAIDQEKKLVDQKNKNDEQNKIIEVQNQKIGQLEKDFAALRELLVSVKK